MMSAVATVLTVYGIETTVFFIIILLVAFYVLQQSLPFTVLKPCFDSGCYSMESLLQQSLPFTVLKRVIEFHHNKNLCMLQQSLPFTVLKLDGGATSRQLKIGDVATVLTVYGIETC